MRKRNRGGARTVLYLRVSKKDQTVENQRQALAKLAELRGWPIVAEYVDEAISGASKRWQCPSLDRLMKDAQRRKFDRVLFWTVDRLGRSLGKTATIMEDLDSFGVEQFYFVENIDTSTPHGQAMLEMSAVFAKLERSHLIGRVHAGLDRARAEGKRLGRPPIDPKLEARIRAALLRESPAGIRSIAHTFRVGTGTVQRIKAAMATEATIMDWIENSRAAPQDESNSSTVP